MSAENNIVELRDEFENDEMKQLQVPVVGMKFGSLDEAYDFYKSYSCKVGFGINRRTSHNFYGFKYDVTFCCNKCRPAANVRDEEGYRSRCRGVVGTGCRARIVVRDRLLNGNWCIEEVELEHNHELCPDCVRLMRCHRELPLFVRKQLEVNECVGLAQNKSISAIFTQAGGVTQCMFTDRDMRNYIAEVRRLKLTGGDAAALMQYFRNQQTHCPNFWYANDVDDEGRLSNVFWADGRSRAAFKYFGDVVTFDSTYLTNRYRMPFAVFVGVNHHGQSILLGCALLANEFKETYDWVFRAFLQCMDAAPRAIITDQCGSICSAVRDVFSGTRHRLCLWHIMKKLPEKFLRVPCRDEVVVAVSKAVYDSRSALKFEEAWLGIMGEFELGDSLSWFQDLYEIRCQWVPIYVKPYFWAGMSTTQRSEGMNAFFDGYVNSRTSLKNFVEKYDVALHSKWEKEKQENFRCLNQRPRLVSSFGFEMQFAEAYTLKMFYTFQKEVKQLINCNYFLMSANENVKVYKVWEGSVDDCYLVHFMCDSQEYQCECMMFQFRGIVCRHALCVYRNEGVQFLPESYVLARWRKDFVRSHVNEIVSFPESHRDIRRYDVLYAKVHSIILNLVEVASRDDAIAEDLINCLSKVSTDLLGGLGSLQDRSSPGVNYTNGQSIITESPTEIVKDPVVVKSKGRPRNRRFESNIEKGSSKKSRKQSVEKITPSTKKRDGKKSTSSREKLASKRRNCSPVPFDMSFNSEGTPNDTEADSVITASEVLLQIQSSCV